VQPCLGAADVIVDSARTLRVPIHVYVFTGSDPTTAENRACLDATTTHELGHAIGLFQHSPNTTDVMYRLPTVAAPSVHDRATAYYLYKGPSQLSPAP
jgi:predicted Zn-dependent protease